MQEVSKETIAAQFIVTRLEAIATDVKDSLRETQSISVKLSALEASHRAMSTNLDRIERQVDEERMERKGLERRIDALEKEAPMQKQIQKWVLSAVTATVTLVLGFVAKFVGLW